MRTKIIPIRQKDSIGCGPACIQMVTTALGKTISYFEIAKISKYKTRDGLSNKQLVQTLEKLGFDCMEKFETTWRDLEREANKLNQVVIVSWMLDGVIGHFSIVTKVNNTHIYLADPSKGKIIKLEKIRFMRLWMDYDDMWYPKKNTDIQLRWMVVCNL
jgi:ATP-binding cassette subfamily B protein